MATAGLCHWCSLDGGGHKEGGGGGCCCRMREGNMGMIFAWGVVGFLKGIGDAKGLRSNEWGQKHEALRNSRLRIEERRKICKLECIGARMDLGRKLGSVTLRNLVTLAKFPVKCFCGSLLQEFSTALQKQHRKNQ